MPWLHARGFVLGAPMVVCPNVSHIDLMQRIIAGIQFLIALSILLRLIALAVSVCRGAARSMKRSRRRG
jgi:hypothetical protein